jgi:DNA-binding HxlR family transcriptional regulator
LDLIHALDGVATNLQAKALCFIAGGASSMAQICEACPSVPDQPTLHGAVRNLTACGAIKRTVHAGPPFRVSYGLTDTGWELHLIVEAARSFSESHLRAYHAG